MTWNPPFLVSFLSETEVIADGRADQAVCQISPRSSHESSGAAERTVQQVRGMVRVYWEHECDKIGSVFPSSSPWWVLALRQAARTYKRFHCSYFQKRGSRCTLNPHYLFGDLLFLAGKPGAHFEHLAGSKAGVFRTRSFRRLTEDRSWSAETVADMEWTLWRTAETTRGRCPKAAVRMNEPLWNAFLSTVPRRIVSHHRDQLEPRLDWRRELDQMPRRTLENLLVLRREGHHCDRRTRVLRNNHQWTIQRRLTQGCTVITCWHSVIVHSSCDILVCV